MTPGFANAGFFLVSVLFTLYLSALWLRILLRWHRAEFHNPIAQAIWQLTNPPVSPLMAVVPRWRHLDTAGLLVLYVLSSCYVGLVLWLTPYQAPLPQILFWGALKVLVVFCNVYTFCIFVQAIMSWFGPTPSNPANALLWSLNEPILRPIRERLPNMGGLDLTPLFVILALQVLVRIVPLPLPFR